MNLDQVRSALLTIFKDQRRWPHQGRKLVFWYDPDGEFQADVAGLVLPGVTTEVMQHRPFALKRRLVIEEPHQDFLLYAPYAAPDLLDNWLLDLELSGVPFTADRAALIFADLGLNHRPLEQTVRDHSRFFKSEKRLQDLKALRMPADTDERGLLTGLLAVAVKVKVPEASAILRQVLLGGLSDGNSSFTEIQKLGLEAVFWQLVRQATSFTAEEPTLRRLFIALLLSHLAHQTQGKLPEHLSAQLPQSTTPGYSLVAAWMRDIRDQQRLQELITEVEDDLGIQEWAQACDIAELAQVDTFPILEKVALRHLVQGLVEGRQPAELAQLARERQELRYASQFAHEYEAVVAAADFLQKQRQLSGPFPRLADQLFREYAADWYQFDRLYREYVTASDQASKDLLRELTRQMEHSYVEWFLPGLNQAWTDAFDEALPSRLDAQQRQWWFYRWHVEPLLQRNDRDRVVVIISDALRFEVASELRGKLVMELRGEATLGSMLSVLPSQTRWGMAALLPGEELAWEEEQDRVLRSGLPTQHGDRIGHLERTGYSSLVMRLDELLSQSTEDARAVLEGKRLVYLYHDAIDALGDKPASERDVFIGCQHAVEELERGVRRLVNSLNSSTVIITADHGFLYQREKIDDPDRLPPPVKNAAVRLDRRAILGRELPLSEGTLRVDLAHYQAVAGPLNGIFPRGTLRFRLQGGSAQYVHGGASLQEMVVPVLTYRHKRAAAGVPQASRKVKVDIVARSRRVTNNVFSVGLVQSEAVTDRIRPRTVSVMMVDNQGQPVTDRKSVTLSSSSSYPTERQQTVRLSVTISDPDDQGSYFLIVTDEEDKLELIREPWEIRIAFKDDFGF